MVPVATWTPPPWPDEIRTVTITKREGRVLTGVCRGWSYSRIANDLGLTVEQVKYSMKSLFRAMGTHDRAHAGILAATGQVDVQVKECRDRRCRCE